MISVTRPEPADDLTKTLGKRNGRTGLTEVEAALWFFENVAPTLDPMPAKPVEAPDFEVYSDPVVKAALNTAFDGRCAYCESRYEHVAPMDVEHYRPKGGVIGPDGKLRKPGYYWLAAAWDNLLPSCIGCNRAREQPQKLPDGRIVEATTGKANLFPLLGGTLHATRSGEEALEQPLLLDPCRDDPGPHLLFRSDGYVEPRRSQEEASAPRGLNTIKVCGLYRAALVETRRKAATRLRDVMETILAADRNCRIYPADDHFTRMLRRAEASLVTLVADLDYRALTSELISLFDRVRPAVDLYARRETVWDVSRSEADRRALVDATRTLVDLHADAGLHQPFVEELYGLADIPVGRL